MIPYTPQQNGVVERKNQTLMEGTTCLFHNLGLDIAFWAKTISTCIYLQNITRTKAVQIFIPWELWYGKIPTYNHLLFADVLLMYTLPKRKE